jgi:hypothetical protein
MYDTTYWCGCDLGRMVNPSALAIAAREPITDSDGRSLHTAHGALRARYSICGLRRYEIGQSYESIALHVAGVMQRPELGNCKLAYDSTGVGAGVGERFDAVIGNRGRVVPVIITGGQHVTQKDRYIHVPKSTLAGVVRSLLEMGDLRISDSLEHAHLLKQELLSFEVKVSTHGNEQFEAGAGANDDLVLATALAVFLPVWWETRQMFIAGPASRVVIPPSGGPARRAATMGGAWTRPTVAFGPGGPRPTVDPDRAGWHSPQRFFT